MAQRARVLPRAQRCIFCRRNEITAEHIFGRKWVARLFGVPKRDKLRHRHVLVTDSQVDFDIWWQRAEADLVAHCVCSKCNSGWMNVLDERVQKVIDPMVSGKPTRIPDLHDQLTLARWITKIACMFDYRQERPSLSREVTERFCDTQVPPQNAHIWIAASPPVVPYHASGFTWTAKRPAGDDEFYLLTARVNDLVMQFFMPFEEGVVPIRERFEQAVCRVWPFTYEQLAWPPDTILNPIDYVDFAMSFIRRRPEGGVSTEKG